jgi:hypothetical protein
MVCHVLLHPQWGSACYPATLFTSAPLTVIQKAVESASAAYGDAAEQPPQTSS